MVRVKRGLQVRKRHKNLIARAKGYRSGRKNVFSHAKIATMKAGQNAYKDRRRKKRDFRRLWNTRINAASRPLGINYSRFINGLYEKNVKLDRKVLSNLTISHPQIFTNIVKFVQGEYTNPTTITIKDSPAPKAKAVKKASAPADTPTKKATTKKPAPKKTPTKKPAPKKAPTKK